MSDFVAKPVVPEILYSKLLLWLSRPDQSHPQQECDDRPEEASNNSKASIQIKRQNISGLNTLKGLTYVNNDISKYKRLLGLFANFHDQDMKRVQAFLIDGDIKEAQRLIHELKGVSAVLGANQISDMAANMEMAFYLNAPLSECIELARLCDIELTELVNAILCLKDIDMSI
jgi:HPt (histidine-containing phosphotransfer) domain-containing protein